MAGLQGHGAQHNCIADVRGLGAMVAIELCKNGDPHQPDADLTKRMVPKPEARPDAAVAAACTPT
jgi:4-aminobutyrate aminotransferase / (S)-3-amino-2-methylpropionate transaminase / 5-aminovalerate transaminase